MGEVYRARDTRLERDVAVKVLHPEFAQNEERLHRFEREAKTLALLNHPNIAGIHGIDSIGDTFSDLLVAILEREPNWDALPPTTAPWLQSLIRRCLIKDTRQRLSDVGEARLELENASQHTSPSDSCDLSVAGSQAPKGVMLPWMLAIAALAGTIGLWFAIPRATNTAKLRIESSFETPAETIYNLELGMALSPDGTRLVYLARDTDGKVRNDSEGEEKLRMRRLDTGETFPLERTEGGLGPFWSPDSQYVAFYVPSSSALKKINVETGVVERIAKLGTFIGGTWSDNGVILVATFGGMHRVSAAGGEEAENLGEYYKSGNRRWPCFLPDGKTFLFIEVDHASSDVTNKVLLGSLDGGKPRVLLDSNANAIYAEPGYILWVGEDKNLCGHRTAANSSTSILIVGCWLFQWIG